MSTSQRKSVDLSKEPHVRLSTRKKSCQNCCDAKARCSLQRPHCSRCQARDLVCHYLTVTPTSAAISTSPASICNLSSSTTEDPRHRRITSIESPPGPTSESAVRIGSRWLDALVPPLGHTPKKLSPRIIQYMSRVLKSYPKIMVKDETLPPLIHPRQSDVLQRPLANCRTLLRMWETRAPGSELMVGETVRREMSRLFDEHRTYDHATLLSAAQAYLLYSIHLFFSLDSESIAMIDTTTMINLQELASAVSLTGLRTLYVMYMFDNIFNFSQNTPSYIATELGQLPAPSSKSVWAATTKHEWGTEYEHYLAEWPSNIPRLEDVWPHKVERIAKERRGRVDRWIETADEFGMFLFAVTSMIHGS
ncbi:hypothetical protein DFH09DRAFT_1159661 [Mycena vulgaris]|nr:hypothetical protein DFH09DRAFT_1159661 [Mycena vulgaris]